MTWDGRQSWYSPRERTAAYKAREMNRENRLRNRRK